MTPTLFGVLTAALGLLLLWRGSTVAMLQTVMALSLMGGSAAIVLTGLGGSTVQPAILALAFLVVRCLAPQPGQGYRLAQGMRDLAPLILFALYGAIGAFILPRLFAGSIYVTPLRPIPTGYLYAAFPLAFSPQNITSAVYLISTLLAATCAYVAVRRAPDSAPIARTAGVIAVVHAGLGLSSVVLANTAWASALKFVRNGNYAQLDQTVDGMARMTGIFPESAVYASYGFIWLVFTCELWLRGIQPRYTGWGAAALTTALILSTSTTGYIGLGAYGCILLGRMALAQRAIPLSKGLGLVAAGLFALAGVMALAIIDPAIANALAQTGARLTVDKAQSASALQRAFWAKQGLTAFTASYGLGIGPGSFRSSSIALAVLGSTGLIGCAALALHLLRMFKPLARSTWIATRDPARDAGAAAAWAALVALIPASVSAPSPDPGLVWGILCGFALGLRRPAEPNENPRDAVTFANDLQL